MLIICSEKSFLKRAKKWCVLKDFFIANATDSIDGEIEDFGNQEVAGDIVPPPTLLKIARDPDSEESKIKLRNLNRYLDSWLSDDLFQMKIYCYVHGNVAAWYNTGEDFNTFIVFDKKVYAAYAGHVATAINELFECEVAQLVTHKMDKEDQRRILTRKYNKDFIERLNKKLKKLAKTFDKSRLEKILEGI